ncbi:hypothetical protein BC834DRAFT_907131 [Gloeopeniophorella convolvens]|nr:hypothetical protein BC834DRAFT_907131 [Gloeopeniophorella convolvens]
MKMHVDVEIKLREKEKELRLFNIFGNLSRQRHLAIIIRRTCSSLRNAYREMLRDSVIGPNTLPLDDFVCNVANRFSSSGFGRLLLGRPVIAHIAILRRFALENSQLLDRACEADEELEDDLLEPTQNDNTRSMGTATPDFGDTEDGSRPPSAMSSAAPRPKKRKRATPTSSTSQPKGSDFWSMVEKWFIARMQPEQLGRPWSSPGWLKYIAETLERDYTRFKPTPIVNPFLDDFQPNDAAANPNGDGPGGAHGQSSSSGAIGSMAAILGTL